MLINPRDDAPVVVGPYALFGMLATGGMASVHLGRILGPPHVARTVAIKRLHPQLAKDPEFIDMFLDEARIVVKIRDIHVVQTLDVVDSPMGLLLIMEYVQGETLSRVARSLRKKGEVMPLPIAAALVANTLRGLHAAHETRDPNGQLLNVVHRDVSPQNIMIATDGIARVLDFGVAKAIGRAHQTRDGQIKGKLSYMAPEQLRGHVDRRTDVFAASIVLWELVTGKRLFEGASDTAVLARVVKADVPPPSSVDPMLAQSVDKVVMRGLAPNADLRYQTAHEMVIALERDVGLATPEHVASWFETVAKPVLDDRRKRLATIEAAAARIQSSQPGEVRSLLPASMSRLSVGSLQANMPPPEPRRQPSVPSVPSQPSQQSMGQRVTNHPNSAPRLPSQPRQHRTTHASQTKKRKSAMNAVANVVLLVLLFAGVGVGTYLLVALFQHRL